MKLSVYTVCYKQQRLLPHFLRHCARWASKIVIWDNCSTDASIAVARAFPHPNIQIDQFDTGGELIEGALLDIKNNEWKGDKSHFVIICDVDEFLYCADLSSFLVQYSGYDVFRPRGYDMVADAFPRNPDRMLVEQVKLGAPNKLFSKTVLFRPDRVREINYSPGCHSCKPIGHGQLAVYDGEIVPSSELLLCHYENLGLAYRLQRHALIRRRLGAEFRKTGFGWHYTVDEETQVREFHQLRESAKQILP